MRGRSRVVAAVVAAVALACVVGASGGWSRTEPEGLSRIAPGEQVRVAPFEVQIERVEARYELDGEVVGAGLAFLVVQGVISLDDDRSVGITQFREWFSVELGQTYDFLEEPQDEPIADIEVATDGSALSGAGPGLSYPVRLVYRIEEAAVPDELTVTLLEHTFRENSIDGEPGWFDAAPTAQVTLDVEPLPGVRPSAEDAL